MNNEEIIGVVAKTVKEILDSSSERLYAPEPQMTLNLAKALSYAVEEKAKEMGVNAVVAVSNSGARPVLVSAMDDSYIASYDVALNKAYTVVSLKMPTKELKKLSQPGESLYGIQFTNSGQIIIFGGGVPLFQSGKIIGGLGVSGGTEEQDTYLADYGKMVFDKIVEELNK